MNAVLVPGWENSIGIPLDCLIEVEAATSEGLGLKGGEGRVVIVH